MKIRAQFFLINEGSDDPRAIEGGGGRSERLEKVARCSQWLAYAYLRAYENRYGDRLALRYAPVAA